MNPEPYNWWWSGIFWYCSVDGPHGPRSGAGKTQAKAARDARIEAWKSPKHHRPSTSMTNPEAAHVAEPDNHFEDYDEEYELEGATFYRKRADERCRHMSQLERDAMDRAFWRSVTVIDDGSEGWSGPVARTAAHWSRLQPCRKSRGACQMRLTGVEMRTPEPMKERASHPLTRRVIGDSGTDQDRFYGLSRSRQQSPPKSAKCRQCRESMSGRSRPVAHHRLFRALLSQLHPGGKGNPDCSGQGRIDLRRGPQYGPPVAAGTGKGFEFARSKEMR